MSEVTHDEAISKTARWVDRLVIGLNLCPFAKAVQVKGQVRYVVSGAETTDALLADLKRELELLLATPAAEVDTTLLIHPRVLADFGDYNDFLGEADDLVAELELEGELQVASFHPDYRFAGSDEDDAANYTNRSPFPMLHVLREASVSRAVEAFPEPAKIYERNIETLRTLSVSGIERLLSGDE